MPSSSRIARVQRLSSKVSPVAGLSLLLTASRAVCHVLLIHSMSMAGS